MGCGRHKLMVHIYGLIVIRLKTLRSQERWSKYARAVQYLRLHLLSITQQRWWQFLRIQTYILIADLATSFRVGTFGGRSPSFISQPHRVRNLPTLLIYYAVLPGFQLCAQPSFRGWSLFSLRIRCWVARHTLVELQMTLNTGGTLAITYGFGGSILSMDIELQTCQH